MIAVKLTAEEYRGLVLLCMEEAVPFDELVLNYHLQRGSL